MVTKQMSVRVSEEAHREFRETIENEFDTVHGKMGEIVENLIVDWVRGKNSDTEEVTNKDLLEAIEALSANPTSSRAASEKENLEEPGVEYDPEAYTGELPRQEIKALVDAGKPINPDHVTPSELPNGVDNVRDVLIACVTHEYGGGSVSKSQVVAVSESIARGYHRREDAIDMVIEKLDAHPFETGQNLVGQSEDDVVAERISEVIEYAQNYVDNLEKHHDFERDGVENYERKITSHVREARDLGSEYDLSVPEDELSEIESRLEAVVADHFKRLREGAVADAREMEAEIRLQIDTYGDVDDPRGLRSLIDDQLSELEALVDEHDLDDVDVDALTRESKDAFDAVVDTEETDDESEESGEDNADESVKSDVRPIDQIVIRSDADQWVRRNKPAVTEIRNGSLRRVGRDDNQYEDFVVMALNQGLDTVRESVDNLGHDKRVKAATEALEYWEQYDGDPLEDARAMPIAEE